MKLENVFSNDTKFLVTGGTGFVGSNLVKKLLNLGYRVRVLDNLSTGKKENIEESFNSNFELIEGDISNTEDCKRACKDVDYVLHQAALGSVPRSIANPVATNTVNINGTLNMLVAARDSNVKKFVYASSSSVYGDDTSSPKREDKLGKPLSPYAISKLTCELYAKNFYELFGLPTIGLRYFNVFGKNQDSNSVYSAVIPIFIKKLLNNEAPTINGDGNHSRDFTYIDNVIQANLKACSAGEEANGEVFNIANGNEVTLNYVYDKMCEFLGVNIKPNYGDERPGDVKHSKADISKAREILKYEPELDFESGLKSFADWFRNNL